MKILVIDDWSTFARSMRLYFPRAQVDSEYRIPVDLSELDNYDILIVDNQGIGNGKWNSGKAFLKDY